MPLQIAEKIQNEQDLAYLGFQYIFNIPLGFKKAGKVWRGGARETREPHVTIGRTVSKKETA